MTTWKGAAGGNVFWPFGGPVTSGGVYPTDPYTSSGSGAWSTHMTSTILSNMVAAGADHIRLQISPGPWLQAYALGNAAMVSSLFAALDVAVAAIQAAGMAVMLSPYMSNFVPTYDDPLSILQGIGTTAYLRYRTWIVAMCSRYASGDMTKVAVGVLNEPPDPGAFPGDWNGSIQPDLYAAIRAVAPAMTIALTGSNYSAISNLTALSPAGYDANVLWEAHPFSAAISALQGYTFSDYQYVVGLEYPPVASRQAANVAAMTALVNASALASGAKTSMITNLTSQLGFYYSLPQDITWIETQYDLLSKRTATLGWCQTHGIPPSSIYIGEWGMTRDNPSYPGAQHLDRVRFYRDHSIEIAKHGFRSAFDHWDTPDYSICVSPTIAVNDFDPALIQAIGLPRLKMLQAA